MTNGQPWTEEEEEILAAHPELTANEIHRTLLPHRTAQAIGNKRIKTLGHRGDAVVAEPPVKPAGDYLETVSAYLADDFECMYIWLKWNGYASYRELNRDMNASALGVVTVLCTAK